jgi:hypothetical protein
VPKITADPFSNILLPNLDVMPYSSDLTDAGWKIFESLLLEILPKKKTRPSNWTK